MGLRRRVIGVGAVAWLAMCSIAAGADRTRDGFASEDLAYWAFQPLRPDAPPSVRDTSWIRTPVDRFVLARLEAAGITPAPDADRATLARRAFFDLVGLPPSPTELEAFVNDRAPGAWERLIDRLLASPRYGERWARHWLDLVRYADSDGYRADAYRPLAWKYRDYVVAAFNEDRPYDVFVKEQLAGDELYPERPRATIATGYLRLWPFETNQRDLHRQWSDLLNDITDVTGEVFLGLGLRCARCHDHKFDPILREDYYRLQGFFSAVAPYNDIVAATPSEKQAHRAALERWREASAEARERLAAFEQPHREKLARGAYDKFTPELKRILDAPRESLAPLELQIRHLADLQVKMETDKLAGALKGETKAAWESLKKEVDAFDALRPAPLPPAMAVVDVGPRAPSNPVPGSDVDIAPGYPAILGESAPAIAPPPGCGTSTGRRAALARWLTRPDNQLALRSIVNRIWQYHFGEGLVPTANDFGRQGRPPSHPELLDWLATEFARTGGSFKAMHRLLLGSSVYRQTSTRAAVPAAAAVDPDNALLWRTRVRRLSAEILRDSMLAASGELDTTIGGPGVGRDAKRRSIYLKVMRNSPEAMMHAFDAPDHFNSCARRNVTTTAPQALLLINGAWTLERAGRLAARVRELAPGEGPEALRQRVAAGYALAFGRAPDEGEIAEALAFVETQAGAGDADSAWTDFCHVLLNANEFLYVD